MKARRKFRQSKSHAIPWIALIVVYPGEMEQEAMAFPVLKVLRGQATAMTYSGKNVWQGFGDIDL